MAPRETIDLSGSWQYKVDAHDVGRQQDWFASATDRSAWSEMHIPNNWYLTEVGDYDGAVWFATSFTLPAALHGKRVTLRFGAVDYIADVWLNDAYLGQHEGYFLPFEFDITNKVQFGADNVLIVRDDAPRDPTDYILVNDPFNLAQPLSEPFKRHWAKDLTQIKGHFVDAMHRPGSMTKYRADGSSGGIWQKVEVIVHNDVQIAKVKLYPKIVAEDGSALISVDLEISNASRRLVETSITMQARPKNFAGATAIDYTRPIQLQPGRNRVKIVRTIQEPQLWWTWDQGKPNLYEAEFTVGAVDAPADVHTEVFGIKSIVPDEQGQWYLNGRRFFIRGMRYLSSLWMSEVTDELYAEDLAKMLDMDINSIRIGSHVEKDRFYSMCDELGLLVWQVFPLHYCYSDADGVIERAATQMKGMVELLYNHASIGMWSVFKEPKIYGLPNPPNNYGRLCQIMWEAARTVDPVRWVHKGDYDEGVQNLMIGSCQPGNIDMQRHTIKPQIVEFGGISIPVLETLKTFIPEDKLWPPDWDTWEYWGLFYNLIFNYGRVEMGGSLEEFIDNSQAYEAKVIKEQIEFLRQRKYAPVASMYLYYWNDACAMMGSGLFDYFRRPYKAYEAMKAVYTPVLVSLEWNKDPYHIGWEKIWHPGDTFVGKLWITNDHQRCIDDAVLSWQLCHEQRLVSDGKATVSLPTDSSQIVDEIRWEVPAGMRGAFTIEMQLQDTDARELSRNIFDFSVY